MPTMDAFLDLPQLDVAGVDEAGRGCLAGPVFAGAVILPPGLVIDGLDETSCHPEHGGLSWRQYCATHPNMMHVYT